MDVPGKALSLVIIDKLPFDSPSEPIFKARCDLLMLKTKVRVITLSQSVFLRLSLSYVKVWDA